MHTPKNSSLKCCVPKADTNKSSLILIYYPTEQSIYTQRNGVTTDNYKGTLRSTMKNISELRGEVKVKHVTFNYTFLE